MKGRSGNSAKPATMQSACAQGPARGGEQNRCQGPRGGYGISGYHRHDESKRQTAAMRSLQEKISYRCEPAGVRLVRVPGDFPSTRMSSRCGEFREMPLRQRVYGCPCCGLVLDRDLNAAINLKQCRERMYP